MTRRKESSKHSPGEWRTGRKVFRTLYADDVLIGMLDRPDDARLCSAAPNMLGALRTIAAQLQTGKATVEEWRHMLTEARAAIAKAVGPG